MHGIAGGISPYWDGLRYLGVVSSVKYQVTFVTGHNISIESLLRRTSQRSVILLSTLFVSIFTKQPNDEG